MSSQTRGADDGLTQDTFDDLNTRFYKAEPWRYFERRLANLLLIASDADRYRKLFVDGVSYGDLKLSFEMRQVEVDGNDPTPSAEQSFEAIELETLLHHSTETLLRFVHAHAEAPACPWLRMS